MSLHARAVDEQEAERCHEGDGSSQSLPRSSERPTTKAPINPLPRTKLLREIPPRCATSKYPSDGFEEAPRIPFWTTPRHLLNERTDQSPPLIAKESTRPPEHSYRLAPTGRSSRASLRELSHALACSPSTFRAERQAVAVVVGGRPHHRGSRSGEIQCRRDVRRTVRPRAAPGTSRTTQRRRRSARWTHEPGPT